MVYDFRQRLIGPKMHEIKPKPTTTNPEMESSWAHWAQIHLGPSRVLRFRDGALWCMILGILIQRFIGPKMHEKRPKRTTTNPEMEPSWAESGPKTIWDHLESLGSEVVHYGA